MNKDLFIEEIKKLNIILDDNQLNQLDKFYQLLLEKNKVMNLTRITDEKEVYLKHFFDSLTLMKAVDLNQNLTLCDVGTGAGFPGIVLKIAFPNLKVTLIDSLRKRVDYLNEVIQELNLTNIEAIHTRSEEYARTVRDNFDIVTSRAVANLKILAEITVPLVKVNGLFIAMKANINEEIAESQDILNKLDAKIERIINFNLPIENSNRNLVIIKKYSKTNKKYPRSIDKIKKDTSNK